jgi:hypothetical protein
MYGTVARMRVKAGAEAQIRQISTELGVGRAPGEVAVLVYQLDRDSRDFILAVAFESKEVYVANANSPEQHARFMQLMQYLEGEPEWNDGEIVFSTGL